MALSDYFLAPAGLLALTSLLGLIVLYLISQQPRRVKIPTIQFLGRDPQRTGARPQLERFRRALLFVIQALVLVAIALTLAGPFLTVPAESQGQAVLVVDASASMGTTTDGSSRFDRAAAGAADDVAGTTTVVLAESTPIVHARRASPGQARAAISTAEATQTPGDLAGAIGQALSAAPAGATIHVYSDFADDTDWRGAVERARARGNRIVLHRFAGGGADNLGIVDLDFARSSVTATVVNTGNQPDQRRLTLGGQSETITLQPGDLTTATFDVPDGGGRLELTPGDSFAADDVVPITAPTEGTTDVLVLTNDRDRFLLTALDVLDDVTVRVERLPASVSGSFDVVVFSGVDPDNVLAGNLALARETLRSGGGVIVTGQPEIGQVGYGDLLLVEPGAVATSTGPTTTTADSLTDGLTFPPPGEHLASALRRGTALVRTSEGSPLVARDSHLGGQLLYYGYFDEGAFPFDASFPVFWKRAIDTAAGRPSLSSLNRQTGDRLTFDSPTTVTTPGGPTTASTVPLREVGVYAYDDRRIGVGLLNRPESELASDGLPRDGQSNGDPSDDGGQDDDETVVVGEGDRRSSTLSLVPVVVALALAALAGELALLRFRGDL